MLFGLVLLKLVLSKHCLTHALKSEHVMQSDSSSDDITADSEMCLGAKP